MARLLSDETIRRRDVRVKIEWRDIEALIAHKAMEVAGLDGAAGVNGIKAEVKMDQETRGSPSYNVGEYSAIVKVSLPVE